MSTDRKATADVGGRFPLLGHAVLSYSLTLSLSLHHVLASAISKNFGLWWMFLFLCFVYERKFFLWNGMPNSFNPNML
jgi:hypothetical protein